ncbi:MAG: homoserine kinase [Thermomicrobiales bacterium]|nr:homoserine kinase [Thermomicrobiales bacterium]MCO5225844.1 homoserine kinase [Thermomicrobiales bacterium]
MRFSVKAPATSANLGPGFDTIGLALDIWNSVSLDTETAADRITNTGTEAPLLHGRENLTLSAMRMLAHDFRKQLPSVEIVADTQIPVSRGLGSSAAALVTGLVATNLLLDLGLKDDDLFERAWAIEGHGDNVGAAIYGGAIMSVPDVHGITKLCSTADLGLTSILFIPDMTGATHAARAALPATIPHKDGTANVAAVAALTVGLVRHDHTLISAGMHDRLHEPYRAALFPHLTPLQEVARTAGAVGAVLSGAGPTVLALVHPDLAENVSTAMDRAARDVRAPGRVVQVDPVSVGYQVSE